MLSVLTDSKRVSVINAPAGSGETRVMTEAARVWAAAGRPVVGITPSQSARNTLAAGVYESYNAAQFLGHLPGQRGGRGPLDIAEGVLLLIDESSMIPTPTCPTWPAWLRKAARRWSWPVIPGSCRPSRRRAMSLLVAVLRYVRLADPVQARSGQPRCGLTRPAWK